MFPAPLVVGAGYSSLPKSTCGYTNLFNQDKKPSHVSTEVNLRGGKVATRLSATISLLKPLIELLGKHQTVPLGVIEDSIAAC